MMKNSFGIVFGIGQYLKKKNTFQFMKRILPTKNMKKFIFLMEH